jgi:hypothetical protein
MNEPWNLTGPQRRQFREAQAAAKVNRPPYKRWRVTRPGGGVSDFRGRPAAYKFARDALADGEAVAVLHWYDGRWGLYERLEPAPESTEGEG